MLIQSIIWVAKNVDIKLLKISGFHFLYVP